MKLIQTKQYLVFHNFESNPITFFLLLLHWNQQICIASRTKYNFAKKIKKRTRKPVASTIYKKNNLSDFNYGSGGDAGKSTGSMTLYNNAEIKF